MHTLTLTNKVTHTLRNVFFNRVNLGVFMRDMRELLFCVESAHKKVLNFLLAQEFYYCVVENRSKEGMKNLARIGFDVTKIPVYYLVNDQPFLCNLIADEELCSHVIENIRNVMSQSSPDIDDIMKFDIELQNKILRSQCVNLINLYEKK